MCTQSQSVLYCSAKKTWRIKKWDHKVSDNNNNNNPQTIWHMHYNARHGLFCFCQAPNISKPKYTRRSSQFTTFKCWIILCSWRDPHSYHSKRLNLYYQPSYKLQTNWRIYDAQQLPTVIDANSTHRYIIKTISLGTKRLCAHGKCS